MRHIDVHTHLAPQILWQAFANGEDWHGMRHEVKGDQEFIVGHSKRILINSPKIRYTPEERLEDMDAEGTDVQVVSIHTPLFPYHWETAEAVQASQEVNDEIAGMTRKWPDRFAGLATLPAQDVDAAIVELDRAVKVLGLKGAELDMVVNGQNWDEPHFLPLFKAAEELDALLFFHPQPQDNIVALERTLRYGIPNSVGVVPGGCPAGGDPDFQRRPGRMPQPAGVHCPRRRRGVFRYGTAGSRLAGALGGAGEHPQAAERVPEADLLRLPDQQRGRPAFPH